MQLLYDGFQRNSVKFVNEITNDSASCLGVHSGCSIRITIVESKDFHMFYVIWCNVDTN